MSVGGLPPVPPSDGAADIPDDSVIEVPGEEPEAGEPAQADAGGDNLVEYFSPGDPALDEIGQTAWRRWDLASRQREGHMEKAKKWLNLYGLVKQEKTWPFANCANIVSPLLLGAVVHTHATLYDMLVPGEGQLYFSKPTTLDDAEVERANNTELVLNQVIRSDIPNYEIGWDDSLWQLVLLGSMFRRVVWGATEGRILADSISLDDFVVPYRCKVLDPNMLGVPSYTWVQYYDPEEIKERIADKYYLNADGLDLSPEVDRKRSDFRMAADSLAGVEPEPGEDGDVQVFEHCCKMQLPKRGGAPVMDGSFHYVTVTIDERSKRVLRITAREKQNPKNGKPMEVSNFLHYKGFPSEGFYGMGFGDFVGSLNEARDAILNQYIDAMTLRNAGGGFVSSTMKSPKGEIVLTPGVYQPITASASAIKDGIYHHDFRDPNPGAIQVVEAIETMANRVTVQGDLLSGDSGSDRKTATEVKTQVELVMKQLSVLMRRIKNTQKIEGMMFWYILSLNLDESEAMKVINPEGQPQTVKISRADFIPDANVQPVADPTITSRTQRIEHAMQLQQLIMTHPLAMQNPQLQFASLTKVLTAYGEYEMRKMMGPAPQPPQPPPVMSQDEENFAIAMGKGTPIHPQDNDGQHLLDMEHHEKTPAFHAMTPDSKALFVHHKGQHLAQQEMKKKQALHAKSIFEPHPGGTNGMAPPPVNAPVPGADEGNAGVQA